MNPNMIFAKLTEFANKGILDETEIGSEYDAADISERLSQLRMAGRITQYQIDVISDAMPGPLLLGEYVVLEEIAAGGMGRVYKAKHLHMDRLVAIKTLPPELESEQSLARFHREARLAAQLDHPNVVRAFAAGEDNGLKYVAMEYVDGVSLADFVSEQGAMDASQAVQLLRHIVLGLEYLHCQGIIHRDIKPGNLLLDSTGRVRITDLGVAIADQEELEDGLTQTGQILGTFDFMSPEQSISSKDADERSDLYSVGCTLFFLLTGEPLFSRDTAMEMILAHRDEPPPSLVEHCPDVLVPLSNIYQRLLAKDPAERFQSAADLLSAIDAIDNAESAVESTQSYVAPTTSSRIDRTVMGVRNSQPPGQSKRNWLAFGAATSLATLVGITAYLSSGGSEPVPARRAGEPGIELAKVTAGTSDEETSIDLLTQIDPDTHTVLGEWETQDGSMVSSKEYPCVLEFPWTIPDEYELHMEVTREQGNFQFAVIIPVAGKPAKILFDVFHELGYMSGLEMVGGVHIRNRQEKYRGQLMSLGETARVRVRVLHERVEVSVNGLRIDAFEGDTHDLGYVFSSKFRTTLNDANAKIAPGNIYLITSFTRFRFDNLAITSLD